jgi:uncharacterized protein
MRVYLYALVMLALLASCGGNRIETSGSTPSSSSNGPGGQTPTYSSEPVFKKEGVLHFIAAKGDTLSTIDIEVAGTDAEREQGLMFRTSIAESTGMLFLFERPEMQSFWMKNTPSSLDILFVAADNRIINIHKFTSPYSMDGLPSAGMSDKVVEVRAGYCDTHKIGPGDKIAYKLEPHI